MRTTRARAGLLDDGSGGSGGRDSRPFGLNLLISSPDRIFIRGRGLDAELGGQLLVSGTTANVVPSGAFNLIRGRLDILGKRLTLSEAQLLLEGDFVPYIRVVASTENDGITTSVVIQGRADEPDVSFTSTPELPEEEVISRLLFGRGLDTISPLQAAQLASAVATLAGRGGEGVIGRLRQGFGLDDLDVATDADGGTSVRAGKYISENVYTQVEGGPAGAEPDQPESRRHPERQAARQRGDRRRYLHRHLHRAGLLRAGSPDRAASAISQKASRGWLPGGCATARCGCRDQMCAALATPLRDRRS